MISRIIFIHTEEGTRGIILTIILQNKIKQW